MEHHIIQILCQKGHFLVYEITTEKNLCVTLQKFSCFFGKKYST